MHGKLYNTLLICRKINKFDTYDSPNSDEDVKYEPQIWVCKSDYHNIRLGEEENQTIHINAQ